VHERASGGLATPRAVRDYAPDDLATDLRVGNAASTTLNAFSMFQETICTTRRAKGAYHATARPASARPAS
jgi:hypothetical protein